MVKLTAIEYLEVYKKPVIVYWTREGFNREMHVVNDFRPYFYVDKKEVIGLHETYKTIDYFEVIKKLTALPQDVGFERRNYDRTWEADVHFTTRFLIDCVPKIDKCDLRIHYTDIEKDVFTDQIISIATYDNYLKKCVCMAWRKDLTPCRKDVEYSFPSGFKFKATLHLFNNPFSMLQYYISFVKKTDPDLMTGWFFTSYDMKEIINEINKVGLKASELSPIHKAYILGETVNKLESNIAVKGRVLWDTMKAYAALQPTRLPEKGLEAIAQKELKEGKHAHKSFKEIWKDMDELCEYNCKDSMLVYRIDQKKHLLDYYDTLRRFVGCEWGNLFHETSMWDCYLLRKLHNTLVLPSKIRKQHDRIKGAHVAQPMSKGIHKNVILIDLKGLYPSIIINFNMSPETLLKESNDNCYKLPNGTCFKKEPIGLLPQVLLELLELRTKFKKERDEFPFGTSEYEALNQQQEAVKILMNALYGAMLYENFRLATPEIGSAITFTGRSLIQFIIEYVGKLGFKVLYGDTDSVFIYAKSDDKDEIVKEMNFIVDELNVALKTFVKDFGGADNCCITIEPKKVYSSLIMSDKKTGTKGTAKKRYGGIIMWANNEFIDKDSEKALEIMGFESKRSDSSALSRDLQKKVIRMLLEAQDIEILKIYISEIISNIQSGKYDLEYVGIPRGLSMNIQSYKTDNPHRRASIYSNKNLGAKFGFGDKPKIIYVSSTGRYPRTDVVAFTQNEDVPADFKMDVDTMIDKSIVMKIEHILDAAGLNINDILHERSKLEEFF